MSNKQVALLTLSIILNFVFLLSTIIFSTFAKDLAIKVTLLEKEVNYYKYQSYEMNDMNE